MMKHMNANLLLFRQPSSNAKRQEALINVLFSYFNKKIEIEALKAEREEVLQSLDDGNRQYEQTYQAWCATTGFVELNCRLSDCSANTSAYLFTNDTVDRLEQFTTLLLMRFCWQRETKSLDHKNQTLGRRIDDAKVEISSLWQEDKSESVAITQIVAEYTGNIQLQL